jgi:photoactive yellow protein
MSESGNAIVTAGAKLDSVESLMSMSQEQVDDLPYGFIVLDEQGVILLYNRYEALMAKLPPERVIGKNFFRDVAPCTRVDAFHGRFRALVASTTVTSDKFAFRFHFLHGAQDVTIELVRVPEGAGGTTLPGARVFMMVQRRAIPESVGPQRDALGLDLDRGRADGPVGPVLPLPVAAIAEILTKLGTSGVREVGAALGAAVVRAADRSAKRSGAIDLPGAHPQLAAGSLDEAMARAGLGRVALDQTGRAVGGVIGCLVRPALELPAPGLAALYEGLLEYALGTALGRALHARCLDEADLRSQPWRFALAAPEVAGDLVPRAGERSDQVARRLGLLDDEA